MFPLKDNIRTDSFPILTIALIALNVVMFFGFQGGLELSNEKVIKYGAIPYEITHPGKQCVPVVRDGVQGSYCDTARTVERRADTSLPATWLTLLASMFMHGGLLHIAGNMLFLWIFGNNIEDALGRVKFILFYLLGGIAALAAQTAISPDSTVPTIGASGAVAAVLGGYILLHPHARVKTLVFIVFFVTLIDLPAMVMLGIWFAQQALFGYLDVVNPTDGGGGVAYFAHIGGFVFGLLTVKLLANREHLERQRARTEGQDAIY